MPAAGPFACLAWSHLETQLLYVAERSRPGHVPGAAGPAEDEDEEVGGEYVSIHCTW